MKELLIFTSIFVLQITNAQVSIGQTTVNSSAALEISSSTNKGVLLPRVDIVDILNQNIPISNPANGLLVYNKGNTITSGLYIWKNGRWTEIADSFNVASYMILQRSTDYTILANLPNGIFKNFNDANLNVLYNNIGATYNNATGVITLPGSSGYIVDATLDIGNSDESPTAGIGNSPIHLHQYELKLIDPVSGIQYGNSISINAQSIASNKSHTLTFSFSFVNSLQTPINLLLAMAHTNGGTYELGLGGATVNNGQITISNIKLDIERSLLNQDN